MNKLFVTASAFIALNDKQDQYHAAAIDFVQSLFNQTLKVYTSVVEIVFAAGEVETRQGRDRMLRFLRYFENGSIKVLDDAKVNFFGSAVKIVHEVKPAEINFQQAILVSILQKNGIKDVFSFESVLKKFNLLVWPR